MTVLFIYKCQLFRYDFYIMVIRYSFIILLILNLGLELIQVNCSFDIFSSWGNYLEKKYGFLSDRERQRLKNETKKMFYFGYDNYMKYAYPMDELDPIHCRGRGPDYDNP